ncbi:MAG: hypothetical protein ACT4PP_14530 [Sporichthyaceae bacterium]
MKHTMRTATVLTLATLAFLPAASAVGAAASTPHVPAAFTLADTDPLELTSPQARVAGVVQWSVDRAARQVQGGVQANVSIQPGQCARVILTWRSAAGAALNTDQVFRCNTGSSALSVRLSPANAGHSGTGLRRLDAALFAGPSGGFSSQVDAGTAEFLNG